MRIIGLLRSGQQDGPDLGAFGITTFLLFKLFDTKSLALLLEVLL